MDQKLKQQALKAWCMLDMIHTLPNSRGTYQSSWQLFLPKIRPQSDDWPRKDSLRDPRVASTGGLAIPILLPEGSHEAQL
jgi:hypothetical protein